MLTVIDIEILKAKISDIDEIMNIIKVAQEDFKSKGIDQWQNNYPNADIIKEDIKNDNSYVLKEEGKIIGTTALFFDGERDYDTIYDGEWLSHGDYGVVHRMAIDFNYRGTGLALILLNKLEELCRENGIYSMKVDTHRENIPMSKLLLKNGYKECGWIYLQDGNKRIAFEKLL